MLRAKFVSGWDELIVAGGVESMSRVPIGTDGGALMYDPSLLSKISYVPQGVSADLIATIEGFTREELDSYALKSHQRASEATEKGYFDQALIPIFDFKWTFDS